MTAPTLTHRIGGDWIASGPTTPDHSPADRPDRRDPLRDRLDGSVLLVRAADADAARRVAEEDIYTTEGIWTSITVRPFGRVASA